MNRLILKNNFVYESLNVFQLFIRYRRRRDIERGDRFAHMEGNGGKIEERQKRSSQYMRARVLLHMIEPPRPINRAANWPGPHLAIGNVHDRAVLCLEHIQDRRIAQKPLVVRLASRCGIKGCFLQGNVPGGDAPFAFSFGAFTQEITCVSNSRRKESR